MYLLDRISKNIARSMATELKYDKDKEEVLAYGAYSIMQTGWSMLLVIASGYILGVFWESLVISFASAILRKYSGGAHASSPNRCAVIGVIIFVPLSLIINNIINLKFNVLYVIIGLEYLLSFVLLYTYCPVDSPAKPIKKKETIKRLRTSSLILISLCASISILLLIFTKDLFMVNLILCISTGFAWQSITLTVLGHFIISKLDDVLMSISRNFMGGEKNE